MKYFIIFFLLTFRVVGESPCSIRDSGYVHTHIKHEKVLNIIKGFNTWLKMQGYENNTKIHIRKNSLYCVGICNKITKKIEVSANHFSKPTSNALDRWATIAHEIGHCVHDLEDNEDLLSDKCAKDFMYAHTMSRRCTLKHWNRYKKQFLKLFKKIVDR